MASMNGSPNPWRRACHVLCHAVIGVWCAASAAGAQTFSFTDDPLVIRSTAVKAVHVQELRTAVNTLRARQGLTAAVFTDPALTASQSVIRTSHIAELRSALDAVFDSMGRTRPAYTTTTLVPGSTPILLAHISELRAAVRAAGLYNVTVTKAGAGTGTVTSSPPGINCGSDCSEGYVPNASVTLSATPATYSIFAGWSGACSGTGACEPAMTADRAVTATFTKQQFTVTVTRSGNSIGSVSSNVGGINCGSTCQVLVDAGTVMTFTANNGTSGGYFVNWSGACANAGQCTLTITGDTTVNAVFATFTIDIDTTRGTVIMPNKFRTAGWSVGGASNVNYVLQPPGWSVAGDFARGYVAVPPGWNTYCNTSRCIAYPPGWSVQGGASGSNLVAVPPNWGTNSAFGYNTVVVPPGWTVGGSGGGMNLVAVPPGFTATNNNAFGTNWVTVPSSAGWSVGGGGGYNNVAYKSGASWSYSRGSNGPNNVTYLPAWGVAGGLNYPHVLAVPAGWNWVGSFNTANMVSYPEPGVATLEVALNDAGWIAWFLALKTNGVMPDSDIADVVIYVLGGGGNAWKSWNNNNTFRPWGWQGGAPSGQWP